jgi:hypothetical protein
MPPALPEALNSTSPENPKSLKAYAFDDELPGGT